MGSWKWKLRKAAGSVIKHTFLGASIASDHMVTLVDLEKVLKETDAPYAPMTPEITKKAYEYMVKGKIGRIGSKLVKAKVDVWGGLKSNLEKLLQCYGRGDVSSKEFRDAENNARLHLHAALALLLASTDDRLWDLFERRNQEGAYVSITLHELLKKSELEYLTVYTDPETGKKVEKTPHFVSWKNPASNKKSVKIYLENKIEWYKTIPKYIPKIPIPIPR